MGDENTIMGLPVKKIKEYLNKLLMKKYLVIGNPIDHSLSPLIHNHWMKKYRLVESVYNKRKTKKRFKKHKE